MASDPHFILTIASGHELDVREVHVDERLSAPFSIQLEVVSTAGDIDFDAAVGGAAALEIGVELEGVPRRRRWTGVVHELRQLRAEGRGLSTYLLGIVPTLWFTTMRRNYRMFQLMSDVDIALKLLDESGIGAQPRLTETHKKRKYRVQYGETDHAFISRLLEDAGVTYFFEEQGGESQLILSDAPHRSPARSPRITFVDEPTDLDREHVTRVEIGRRIRPGRYSMRDHDYRRPPAQRLLGGFADGLALEQRLESFHYTPGGFLYEAQGGGGDTPHADDKGRYRIDWDEGKKVAQRRLEAARQDALTSAFESNVFDLWPGMVIGIEDHPRGDVSGADHLITAMKLRARRGEATSLGYEARSAAFPYRPPLATPKPRTHGLESATVVGPEGEEIHTDEFGRVRVHFHWDRDSAMDEDSSCWLHVSQPWAGAGYGLINLPRVGHEVLVDFLSGDPDRPVIVGRVFTNLQRVPYTLPENKTQSGWRSHSSPATGGYNELMFEDKAGEELVNLQAERDLNIVVKRNKDEHIANDRTRNVGNNESVTVAGDRTKVVLGSELEETGGNRSVFVGGNRSAQVGSTDSVVAGEKIMMGVPHGGSGDKLSSLTISDQKMVLDTGAGASITLSVDEIILDAKKITIKASDELQASGGSLAMVTSDAHAGMTAPVTHISATHAKMGGAKVSIAASGTTDVSGVPLQLNGPGLFCGRVTELAVDTITTGAALVLVGGASFPYEVVKLDDGTLKVGEHILIKPSTGRYKDFQNKVLRDLGVMSSTEAGRQRLENLQNNPNGKDTTIREWSEAESAEFGENNSGCGADSQERLLQYDDDGNPVPGSGANSDIGYNPDIVSGYDDEPQPADATLFHEMGHAEHNAWGTNRRGEEMGGGWDNREEWQNIEGGQNQPGGTNDIPGGPVSPSENQYNEQRGYPYRRTDHGDGWATPDGTPV